MSCNRGRPRKNRPLFEVKDYVEFTSDSDSDCFNIQENVPYNVNVNVQSAEERPRQDVEAVSIHTSSFPLYQHDDQDEEASSTYSVASNFPPDVPDLQQEQQQQPDDVSSTYSMESDPQSDAPIMNADGVQHNPDDDSDHDVENETYDSILEKLM